MSKNYSEVSYLNSNPSSAVETIRKCIVSGYELKNQFFNEDALNNKIINESIGAKWDKQLVDWINNTYKSLNKIYSSPVEPLLFVNTRGTYMSISNTSAKLNELLVKLEAKIDKLIDLYKFIFEHTNIRLTAKGNINFIYGDKNVQKVNNNED